MRLDDDVLAQAAATAGLTPASLVVLPLDLPAGPVVLDPDLPLYPASMIKVPLVAAALVEVAAGRLDSLESKVTIRALNMTANDTASPLVPGYQASLHELMELAIARSDNVATNELFDLVGRERATQIARDRFGLANTGFYRKVSGSEPLIEDPQWDGIHRNSHPASDCAHLFRLISDNAVPHAGLLRDMLAAQRWNNKLSRGLRSWDRFAHKTGDTEEVTHDGGILTTGERKRYVVVAYTGMPSNDENNARFGTFMAAIRDVL